MTGETPSVRSGWIAIASLALGSLISVGLVWRYYSRQQEAIEGAVYGQIAAISQTKVAQIANWRRERLGDGRVQAVSGTIKIARRILSGGAANTVRADLIAAMRQLETEFSYTGASLVDRNGEIRVQYPADHSAPSKLADFARAGAAADDVKLEDLYLDARSKRPLMALTIPVHGLGALILEIDPSRFLYPYINSWPGPGSTAETHLVRLEGPGEFVYLSDLQHRSGSALVWKRPLSSVKGLPPLPELESERQVRVLDYRGVPVLGIVRRIPDSPWYLTTKIDASEVDGPVRRLGWEMAILTALIGIANLAVVGLVWRSRELRIRHEREEWFHAVANDTPAYLWMTAGEEQNSFINRPLAKFLGTNQDVLASHWTDPLHPDDRERARATFLECLAHRRDYVAEYRVRRWDGQYRWGISRGLPRISSKGEFLGYAGSLTDITETREAEQQLRATNAALAVELAERRRHEEEIESLSARLMNAQEDERKRLARELHDGLCQQIAALSLAVGNLKRNIPKDEAQAHEQSDRIQQKLAETAETVRQISHQLHPAILEYSGLVPALQAYCAEFSSLSGIRIVFDAENSIGRVEPDVALSLYRITQEALQNVAKHAQVPEARVTLRRSAGLLCLTIEDHGIGMATTPPPATGLGLVSIKERARLIHGTLEISSQPNRGTAVMVKVPQKASAAAAAADGVPAATSGRRVPREGEK